MKTKLLAAVTLMLAAGTAAADGYDRFWFETQGSTAARAGLPAMAQSRALVDEIHFRLHHQIVASDKSRAQVRAEAREAQRLGLLPLGDGDVPQATAEQQRLIVLAGQRALDEARTRQMMAAKR